MPVDLFVNIIDRAHLTVLHAIDHRPAVKFGSGTTGAAAGVQVLGVLLVDICLGAGVLLWQLSIRMYIGLSATAEGKGKTKGWLYLAVTGLVMAAELQIAWEAFGIDRILAGEVLEIYAIVSAIISFIMELASAYVLLELLISGICVKLLRKKMKA